MSLFTADVFYIAHADSKATHHLTDKGVLSVYELVGTRVSVMQMQRAQKSVFFV